MLSLLVVGPYEANFVLIMWNALDMFMNCLKCVCACVCVIYSGLKMYTDMSATVACMNFIALYKKKSNQ